MNVWAQGRNGIKRKELMIASVRGPYVIQTFCNPAVVFYLLWYNLHVWFYCGIIIAKSLRLQLLYGIIRSVPRQNIALGEKPHGHIP
jgi:hypothetical protein